LTAGPLPVLLDEHSIDVGTPAILARVVRFGRRQMLDAAVGDVRGVVLGHALPQIADVVQGGVLLRSDVFFRIPRGSDIFDVFLGHFGVLAAGHQSDGDEAAESDGTDVVRDLEALAFAAGRHHD